MPELKPCPFCGGEATFHTYGGTCNVVCDDCRIGTLRLGRIDEHEVIGAWNTRAERTCIAEENIDASYGDCMFVCSECGADLDNEEFPNYCPQCGAKVVE